MGCRWHFTQFSSTLKLRPQITLYELIIKYASAVEFYSNLNFSREFQTWVKPEALIQIKQFWWSLSMEAPQSARNNSHSASFSISPLCLNISVPLRPPARFVAFDDKTKSVRQWAIPSRRRLQAVNHSESQIRVNNARREFKGDFVFPAHPAASGAHYPTQSSLPVLHNLH